MKEVDHDGRQNHKSHGGPDHRGSCDPVQGFEPRFWKKLGASARVCTEKRYDLTCVTWIAVPAVLKTDLKNHGPETAQSGSLCSKSRAEVMVAQPGR